jgi:hypothetical protein
MAGRSDPSPQRSPAAITAMVSLAPTPVATAAAFLRQPATTAPHSDWANRDSSAPFGEGRTSRVPGSIPIKEDGDRERPPPSLDPARTAFCSAAKLAAPPS